MRAGPRSTQAAAVRELALAAPLLALWFLGVYDATLYLLTWQRLERASAELGGAVAAGGALPDETALQAAFARAGLAALPSDVTQRGTTVISALRQRGGAPTIVWQRRIGATATSRYGFEGETAMGLPGSFALEPGQTRIVAEMLASPGPWSIRAPFLAGWLPERVRGVSFAEAGP